MSLTRRGVSAGCAFVFFCLSVSHSAPLACEDLLRPLSPVDLLHLEGRRAMVAGSLSQPSLMERLGQRDSATAAFSNITSGGLIYFSRSMRLDDACHYSSYNVSLEGGSFAFDNSRVNTTFVLTSCHDCLLLSFDVESGTRRHFYLFSRRRQLEQEEMEEFQAQVACLNMPPPAVMDPTKELCPEQQTSDPSAQMGKKSDTKKN